MFSDLTLSEMKKHGILEKWLKQGLEPTTFGFPLNRKTSAPKSCKKTSHCKSRTLFVMEYTQRDIHKAQKLLFPQLGTAKNSSCWKPRKTKNCEKKSICFSESASGESHRAENPKESSLYGRKAFSFL